MLADVVAAEILAAQDELDNRAIIQNLSACLAIGGPHLVNGRLLLDHLELSSLTTAITVATQLGPKTPEAMLLLLTAKVIRKLRMCLQTENYTEARTTLDAIRGRKLPPLVASELRVIQEGVDNWVRVFLADCLFPYSAGLGVCWCW